MESPQPRLCEDCKASGKCQAFEPEIGCPEYNDKLNQIARALEAFHAALRRRENGHSAAWKFASECEDILEMQKNI